MESDFTTFANYFGNEETARYVGGKKTKEESWRLVPAYIGHYQLKGFGYMAVEDKANSELIGCVGLWKSDPWPELELGYWLLDGMHGKGYASEAAQRVIEFAYDALGVSTLVSYIDPVKRSFNKTALRLGAKYEKQIELLNFGKHNVFRYA